MAANQLSPGVLIAAQVHPLRLRPFQEGDEVFNPSPIAAVLEFDARSLHPDVCHPAYSKRFLHCFHEMVGFPTDMGCTSSNPGAAPRIALRPTKGTLLSAVGVERGFPASSYGEVAARSAGIAPLQSTACCVARQDLLLVSENSQET